MCGRYSQTLDTKILAKRFGFPESSPKLKKRYNIAPGQPAPLVLGRARRLALFKWGLTPKWADGKFASRMINARAETVHEKRAYQGPFRKARCLVLADGFYEWRADSRGVKAPFRFLRPDKAPFAFAGLYDNSTFTILTTQASGVVKPIHDRMPVILPKSVESAWLNPKTPAAKLEALLKQLTDGGLESVEVSTYVNAPKHDDERCIAPLGEVKVPASELKKPGSQMEMF